MLWKSIYGCPVCGGAAETHGIIRDTRRNPINKIGNCDTGLSFIAIPLKNIRY
jgi:hypothetical protein